MGSLRCRLFLRAMQIAWLKQRHRRWRLAQFERCVVCMPDSRHKKALNISRRTRLCGMYTPRTCYDVTYTSRDSVIMWQPDWSCYTRVAGVGSWLSTHGEMTWMRVVLMFCFILLQPSPFPRFFLLNEDCDCDCRRILLAQFWSRVTVVTTLLTLA